MSFDFSHQSVSLSRQSDLRKIKLGAHCLREFLVNLMYVNLTIGKFVLILCKVHFLRVVNVHR